MDVKNEFLDVPEKQTEDLKRLFNIATEKDTRQNVTSRPDIKRLGESSALSRVRNFLPELRNANRLLETRISEGKAKVLSIENTEDCEKVIEMDVALMPTNIDENLLNLLYSNSAIDSEDSDSESDSESGEEAGIKNLKDNLCAGATQKNLIEEMVQKK